MADRVLGDGDEYVGDIEVASDHQGRIRQSLAFCKQCILTTGNISYESNINTRDALLNRLLDKMHNAITKVFHIGCDDNNNSNYNQATMNIELIGISSDLPHPERESPTTKLSP